jgi:rhodanese-related sulfurtransferase
MKNLKPAQIQQLLGSGHKLFLLDVREKWEFEICHIDTSQNIPMGAVPGLVEELNTEEEIVVICHHGARSLQVANYLEINGFSNVINLDGGVDAWAKTIDPNMPQY